MTHGSEQHVKETDGLLNAIATLLKNLRAHRQIDKPFTLHIHQFGHTALYVPVYMALESVLETCAEQARKENTAPWLRLQYSSHEPDSEVERSVTREPRWSESDASILHLGLSEVHARRKEPVHNWIVEQPIVRRLPLWGIALVDNQRIEQIRERRERAKVVGERSRFKEFRKLFAGKMSLLRPQDGDWRVSDEDAQLAVSIYEEGSTAYEFFRRYLDKNGQDIRKLRVKPIRKGFEEEFDALFSGKADIALTVQPWRALRLAEEQDRRIEVVYTHLGRPEPVTSLYMRRDPEDSVDLWSTFLAALGALVQVNVGMLYDCYAGSLAYAYAQYKRAAERQVEVSKASASAAITNLETQEDFEYAIQLLGDSRVYYYDLPIEEAELARKNDGIAIALNSSLFRYFADSGKLDPAYCCSVAAALIRQKKDWHANVRLAALKGVESERLFNQAAMAYGVRFENRRTLPVFRTEWCVRRPQDALKRLYRQCDKKSRPFREPWRVHLDERGERESGSAKVRHREVDFTPWIHKKAFADGLLHFDAQFGKAKSREGELGRLKLKSLKADVLLLGQNTNGEFEALSWLWIEYQRATPGPAPENKFFDKNKLGQQFLNAWYIYSTSEGASVRRVFERAGHGQLNVDNGVPELTVETPVLKVLRPTNKICASEALLFTFHVAGIENRANYGTL